MFARLFGRDGGATLRRKDSRLGVRSQNAALRIREHLNSELVFKATAEAAQEGLGSGRTSVWLSAGTGTPILAYPPHASGTKDQVPGCVAESATYRRLVLDKERRGVALPIVAPRSGMVGVLYAENPSLNDDQIHSLESIARESGLAIESANLYEKAIAEKEKSQAILAHIGDAVVVSSPKGRIVQVNEAAVEMLSCAAKEQIGQSCASGIGLHMGERPFDCSRGCELLAMNDSSRALPGVEVWRKGSDGKRQPLLATASSVKDPEGNVAEVVHSFRDITRLKEADEAKTLFLATASHELKTPLTVIQGFSQVLSSSRYSTDVQRVQAMEAIERRAIQLNKIVDRLLLSSRIESGRVEITSQEVDVAPILVERTKELGASSGRDVFLDVAADLPQVQADPDAVTTVVDHLLDNAVKYSPDGGVISVRGICDDSRVVIIVADSGIGMDSEKLLRCFEKFWQGEMGDARRFGGTGIGLFIVRSLVEAMGGEISVESAPGSGSTFSVSLPRVGAQGVRSPSGPPRDVATADQSVIREFMRQIGIPTGGGR